MKSNNNAHLYFDKKVFFMIFELSNGSNFSSDERKKKLNHLNFRFFIDNF